MLSFLISPATPSSSGVGDVKVLCSNVVLVLGWVSSAVPPISNKVGSSTASLINCNGLKIRLKGLVASIE